MKLAYLLTVQPWQTERALKLCLCAIARDCVLVLMWEMQNRMPLFCPSPIPSFPLYCAFKSIGKKGKRLTRAGRCLCFTLYCNIFCAAFMLCKLHYLECSPPKEIILYFLVTRRMWYFSPSFPHCALRQYYTIGKNKTKKQQFYKTDLCKTAWRNILHLERLNLQGKEIAVRLTFPALPPIRRKAIGNGEIREVILESGRVLIIIMSAAVCVRVCYNVTRLKEGTVCECDSACGFSCVCVCVFLITSASGAWASWHINVRYRWHTPQGSMGMKPETDALQSGGRNNTLLKKVMCRPCVCCSDALWGLNDVSAVTVQPIL